MTSRERVHRCLAFDHPDRAPRDQWALPGVLATRAEEWRALVERYPSDFGGVPFRYGASTRAKGREYRVGRWADEWGSVWEAKEDGVAGEVKDPPLASWDVLGTFTPPWELLDGADLSGVNEACARSGLFIKAPCCPRPFERMQFLRGTEALFLDLAWGVPEAMRLREMVHDYYMRELAMWVRTDVDAVMFMDDWGTQTALLISPAQWREVYKPLYKDYCDLAHAHGKRLFMHSDGFIEAIYPDLIEIGVDALNSQLFCMDIEGLGERFRGKITFWGEIDRQHILPHGTVEDVREAVRRVRRALESPAGGAIAQCEWGLLDPADNLHAVFETWLEPWPG